MALCTVCHEVLNRPPLIGWTDNGDTYLVDDLYALDYEPLVSSPPPCPSEFRTATPPLAPRPSPGNSGGFFLFFTSIATVAGTLFAAVHLRPHLVGLNSLDVLVIVGVIWLWQVWWAEVKKHLTGK